MEKGDIRRGLITDQDRYQGVGGGRTRGRARGAETSHLQQN